MNDAKNDSVYRGLLFPVDGPVAPISIRESHLMQDLYRAMQCSMLRIVKLAPGTDLWCDEEAMFRRPLRPNRAWLLRRTGFEVLEELLGNVVAVGCTDDGSKSRTLTLDEADEVFTRIVGTNRSLAVAGDPRPAHPALAAWIRDGIDWRQ